MNLPDDYIVALLEQLEALAVDNAKAKATESAMVESRKMTKARLMKAYTNSVDRPTIQKAEMYAYTHPEYKQAVEAMIAAQEAASLANWMLRIKEIEWESWRSLGASARVREEHLKRGG